MDRYEVMAGKMAPLTDGAHRKWGFTGKVETRSYERLVDALIDFVETGDGLKARFLTGFAACLAADRKSVENRGFVPLRDGKLSWKGFFPDKAALGAMQDRFYERVGALYGLSRGEKRGDGEPVRRHKSVAEYKAENRRVQAELDEKSERLEAVTAELAAVSEDLKEVRAQCSEYKAKLDGFAAAFEKIKVELAQIVDALSVKSFLGSFKAKLVEFAENEVCKAALAAGREFKTARDGKRAERVLVSGAREKIGEMERLGEQMDAWSPFDEADEGRAASRELERSGGFRGWGDDGYGNEPNATVAYLSSLEGSREERAFELAKNEYLAWLEHKADRYTTVYGYMGLGDRYEQHLL